MNLETLKELHREQDAAEIKLAGVLMLTPAERWQWLRESKREMIASCEMLLPRSYAMLDGEGLGRMEERQ